MNPAGRAPGARVGAVLLFLAAFVFNFLTASAIFFGLLAFWGRVLAPRFGLPASSPVILVAFILAAAGSAAAYRVVARRSIQRLGGHRGRPEKNPGEMP